MADGMRSCLWCGSGPVRQKFCCAKHRDEAWTAWRARRRAEYRSAHRQVVRPGEKRCAQCLGIFQASTQWFRRDASRPDGLDPRCKACVSERRAELKAGAPRTVPWGLRRADWFGTRMASVAAAAKKESSSCAT